MDNKILTICLFLITQTAFLSGCANYLSAAALVSSFSINEINQGSIQVVPTPASDSSKSVITITRLELYAQYFVNYTITQNDKRIGILKPGSYIQWEADPGVTTLTYRAKVAKKCYTNSEPCITKEEDILESDTKYPLRELRFTVKDGEHYNLRLESDWYLFTNVPRDARMILNNEIDLSKLKPPIYIKLNE